MRFSKVLAVAVAMVAVSVVLAAPATSAASPFSSPTTSLSGSVIWATFSGEISYTDAQTLLSELKAAATAYLHHDYAGAIAALDEFKASVTALVAPDNPALADQLISAANHAIDYLNTLL